MRSALSWLVAEANGAEEALELAAALPWYWYHHGLWTEGAQWLEKHGGRYGLYRVYDNEWWHFEYRTAGPVRLPHPDAAVRLPERGAVYGLRQIYGSEPCHH